MKTDEQLKADIVDELAWDPAINASGLGVEVQDGVVTLDGFSQKHALERALQRVEDVRCIALALDVHLSAEHKRSDSELAQMAATALKLQFLGRISRRRNPTFP